MLDNGKEIPFIWLRACAFSIHSTNHYNLCITSFN